MREQSDVVQRALGALRAVCLAEPEHGSSKPDSRFAQWLTERCVKSDGLFSAIGELQIGFCAWLAEQDEESCTRPQFELLLRDAGYLLADGLASGLMLYADVHGSAYEQLERLAIRAESGAVL